MSRTHQIVCMPGDGIGPEIMAQAQRVLEAVSRRFDVRLAFTEEPVGGRAIEAFGVPVRDQAIARAAESDAVLFGAVGDPRYDDPSAKVRPEQAILQLRKSLGLFANLRPVTVHPRLAAASPLRPHLLEGVDILFVRELTGGIYFGERARWRDEHGRVAKDTLRYDEGEIRRVVEVACDAAKARRGKVTSVDKANVLDSSRLWREVANEVHAAYPGIELEHALVDSFAMRVLTRPRDFDVVVTGNMFGDILSDEASVLPGSLGVMPSASLGASRPDGTRAGLYEPIHGSAPDIAGQGIANPIGMILSAAALLRHSLGLEDPARAIEDAVAATIDAGVLTPDLGGGATTADVGGEVAGRVTVR